MEKQSTFQKLMGFVNKAGTFVMMNLLFLVCSLPVVTMGAAWCGLYGAVRYTIRGESWFAGFKEGFKGHFWRNLIGWTFGVLVAAYSLSKVLMGVSSIIANPALLTVGVIVPLVISALFLLASLLVVAVMLPLGMYFPQLDANTWLMTAWDVILHAPLQALGVVALMWGPVIAIAVLQMINPVILLVMIAIYFIFAAFAATLLLKKPLLRILKRYPREEE